MHLPLLNNTRGTFHVTLISKVIKLDVAGTIPMKINISVRFYERRK